MKKILMALILIATTSVVAGCGWNCGYSSCTSCCAYSNTSSCCGSNGWY